ncbi:MAG: 16S rRNA (guanine(527)-N(7))-methyltransferase RsmG [Candidatus Pelagibacter sp. TMED273]|nr:MAG: 16S rRNA (guanine(527)-N(7))-methyltransferase RsmG [Candidatus Pelagibacter sp. TMED273]|tara:strand:+ start:5242 stop:5859 length:618 start_codon:yes stop_codon:yes gene_type:complete
MDEHKVIDILIKKLNFSKNSINKLKIFHDSLLIHNKRYNLISRNTENSVWFRHILDSAQIVKFFNNKMINNIGDFGSGAGFPGIILSIYGENMGFHVKLYEKSPVKRDFLKSIKIRLNLKKVIIEGDIYEKEVNSDVIVCRAFKKLGKIIRFSRETIKKPHKLIILKGKNAQTEINSVSLDPNYSYKLEDSITDQDSKIILIDVK